MARALVEIVLLIGGVEPKLGPLANGQVRPKNIKLRII